MKRWVLVLLVFSLAANVGLVSAIVTHWVDGHRRPPWPAGPLAPAPPPDLHPGRGGPPGGERTEPGRFFRRWPERRIERLSRHLQMTPEQRARLERELSPLRDGIAEATRELARLRRETAELVASDSLDPAAVRERMRRGALLQARIDSLVAEAMLREVSVLTPEQRRRYRRFESGERRW